jgi:cysteine protease ATG4
MESPNSISSNETVQSETLSKLETLRLGAAHAYYSVSRALRFDKVASLLQRAELSLDSPVALVGTIYSPAATKNETAAREVLSHLVHHFHSTPWMTYRSDFAPLPAGEGKITLLKTDAGWGCTLRSIQMLAAQTMCRHFLGRDWRWPLENDSHSNLHSETATNLIGLPPQPPLQTGTGAGATSREPPSGLVEVLRLFWDVHEANSPFSIHNICYYGAECGIFPGRWLGPSTGCRALAAAASAASTETHSAGVFKGLNVGVLGGTGGGAPVLGIDRYLSYFEDNINNDDNPATATTTNSSNKDNTVAEAAGFLLLIPLVLGIGKLNPDYYPQLRAVLAMPHSVGIVGGRPGSSVYVVGCQGESLLYLDPHTIQPAATSASDWESYSCDVLRTMWLSALDPSLALGFYCKNKEDYLDLCEKLKELEEMNPGMPLVCVREGMGEAAGDGGEPQSWEEDEIEEEEEEEVNFDEDETLELDNANKEDLDEEEGEKERQYSELNDVPIMGNGGGGGDVVLEGKEEEEAEEEMQRRISELRQQSSKSVWEFV